MQNNSQNINRKFLDEYFGQVRRTLFILLSWGLFVVLNFCIMGNVSKIPSFLFGFSASAFYYILMYSRIKKLSGMPTSKAVAYMQNGWAIRLSFMAAVSIIALKMPWIDFGAAAIGLFSSQIAMMIQAAAIVITGLVSKYKKI